MLRTAPFLMGLSADERVLIAGISTQMPLLRDEILYVQNEPCSAVYYLVSGRIGLQVSGHGEVAKTVELVAPGETFAEEALFSGYGYPCSAVALEESLLVGIQAYALARHVRANPTLACHLLTRISRRLYQRDRQIETLGLSAAEQRVAAFILEHCDQEDARYICEMPPRRKELASFLGITVETLCRVLSSFKKRNLIRTEESHIDILDYHQLQSVLHH